MSYEKVITILTRLGLSTTDANIYLYLTIRGQHNAKALVEGLKLPKSTVYKSLKRLKDKRIITSTHEYTLFFDACSIEEIMTGQIKTGLGTEKFLKENKDKILNTWENMIHNSC